MSDGDGSSTNGFGGRATHVASTLVAAGVDARAKGMSPGATLLTHDWYNDFTEITAAFANATNHFRISNHSYSRTAGWTLIHNRYHAWFGDPAISPREDCRFGFYNRCSQNIDDIA